MITCQCAEAMRTYATQSSYLTPIPNVNIDRGVIPLDSLPADWWNWLWHNITLNEGYIVQFINSVFSEINSVLSAAGVSPSTASTTDLRDAIQALAQVVATSSVPGSVLSSTLSGKLNVIADGTATINGLGTPSDLQTTADSVVAAINEVLALAQGKAPTSHASSATTYGVGTTQQYGHVKLCDSASSAATSAAGVAATPAAVKSVADSLASYQSANNAAVAGKAPISHASSATTYGVGTTQLYGHVKVTEGCGLSISGGTISLNAPGYNCLGNVTIICFNGNKYTPTNGVINLGTPTINANCVCQRAISSSTAGDFYPILGGGRCRTTSGVGEVNLVGLRWNPVCCSLEWNNSYVNIGACACNASLGGIAIGCGAYNASTRGIAIGAATCIGCCSTNSVAIGHEACIECCLKEGVAIGPKTYNASIRGLAIGQTACIYCCSPYSIAIGQFSCVQVCSDNSIAIGYESCIGCCSSNSVAIGHSSYNSEGAGIAIGLSACNASLGGTAIGCWAVTGCCSANSVAIGTFSCVHCCSPGSVAIGLQSTVQAYSACSVAIGSGAFAGCISCNGRNFYLQTIGDAYQLRMYVCSTSASFQWCDLAKTLQTLFRNCYQGRYASCPNYIYLSRARGTSFCSAGINYPDYPSTGTDEFIFIGVLARSGYERCACWVDIYWGDNRKYLSCTTTGRVPWLDTQGRTIMINGLIGGI